MSYSVFLHPRAAAFLKQSNVELRNRIVSHLEELMDKPEEKGERLKPSQFLRLRIGNYRAIYTVNQTEKKVAVLFIGHRKEVYDDFSRIF